MWLDPGKVTGYSRLLFGGREPWFNAWEVGPQEMGNLIADQTARHGREMILGWEAYLGSGGTPRHALEVIGVARYFATKHNCVIVERPASSRLICRDEHLRELGWHRPGKEHANQATRHLVAWLLHHNLMMDRLKPVFTNSLK